MNRAPYRARLAAAVALALAVALPTPPAIAALPTAATPTAAAAGAASASVAAGARMAVLTAKKKKKKKPAATVSATATVVAGARIAVAITSNAKSVQVSYKTTKGKKRSTTRKLKKGAVKVTLAARSRSVKVRAKATATLAASRWVPVSLPAATAAPSAGGPHTVSPDSPILGKMASWTTVNQYTRHYYLIRSYMEMFEGAGGGTLVLGPGRYEISSTIYVPSNVTIRLSEGTTLVKSNQTGTTRFSASSSMFMLVRPSLGKVSGAVGGYDGDRGITIAGAGAGRSVIDMANIHNSLAIISGHNREVTISGITFARMNNNHFIEMDGCADCVIAGNEFLDAAGGTRETAEAINLDTPDPVTKGFGSVWSKLDGTPNVRVTVTGNRFHGMQRALGTHNFTAGSYHTDIVVTNNTITGNANDAIHIMNWTNPVFSGNAISSSGGSTGIKACGTSNPTITGNTFSESGAAVAFRTCTGEHGTTRANAVTGENVTALRANVVGSGLRVAYVSVPEFGTVWFNGHEPPPTVPSMPYAHSVVNGDGRATVTWSAPWADPRAPITGYRIRVQDSAMQVVQTLELPAEQTEAVITGLVNGTRYYVTVVAVNSVGESSGSWTDVNPVGLPTAPTQVAGSSSYPGSATITWSAPAGTGGQPITQYRVHAYADAGATQPLASSPQTTAYTTMLTWSGLPAGTTIHVRVSAVNVAGEGPTSELVAVDVKADPTQIPPLP